MRASWTFEARQDKGAGWYAAAGACLTAVVIWGFLWDYPLLSVVAMALAGVYLYAENDGADQVEAAVDERGVEVAGKLYEYAAIRSFSIIYEGNEPSALRLALERGAIGQMDVPLPAGADAPELRAFLSQWIPEAGATEYGAMESVIRRLKI